MENETKGRKPDQKMKPFLVYQYLLKNTDENHFVTADVNGKYFSNLWKIVYHSQKSNIDCYACIC